MGFFSDLFGGGNDPAKIQEIAEEVERYADRFENADDQENAALARGYAARIRKTETVKDAKILRAEFLAIVGKDDMRSERVRNEDDTDSDSDDS